MVKPMYIAQSQETYIAQSQDQNCFKINEH